MIRGAAIFAGGLAVGTAYGFFLGLRLSKGVDKFMDAISAEVSGLPDVQIETVQGETVPT